MRTLRVQIIRILPPVLCISTRSVDSLSILALATGTEGLNTINFTNSVSWLCPDKFLLAQYVKM